MEKKLRRKMSSPNVQPWGKKRGRKEKERKEETKLDMG